MNSLEKKMFFLPNRLYVSSDKIYVSFNISSTPKDMNIGSIYLHIPLIKLTSPTKVYLKELLSGWSEKNMQAGIVPPRSELKQRMTCVSGQNELIINVTDFKKKWRLPKKSNHGIYIRFKNRKIDYIIENPPYLVIDTP